MAREFDNRSDLGDFLHRSESMNPGNPLHTRYEPGEWASHAIKEVFRKYGDIVDVKPNSLQKFGENLLVGTTQATIATLPSGILAETLVTANTIDTLSSSSAGDTQDYYIEGQTVSGGVFTFVSQTITANGQNKVVLDTPLARCTRIANMGATDNAGIVSVYEETAISGGVPSDGSKVHASVPIGENQTLKAMTAISGDEYLFLTDIYASLNKKTGGSAVIRLRVRDAGGVFRTVFKRAVNSLGPDLTMTFRPYLIIAQNSDIMLTAEADGASTAVAGGFNGVLAAVRKDN